jgi:peptidyl-prolyl cis-trans isomerase C
LKVLAVLVGFVAALVLPAAVGGADPEVLVRVNGEPVTRGELQRVMADSLLRGQLQQELGVPEPDGKEVDRLALGLVIKRRLILQEAGRRQLTVTEREIDEAVTALRRRFPDLKTFGPWLKERGLNDRSLFDAVRTDLLVARVRATLVEGLRVSDEQVWAYYEARKGQLKTSEAVRLRVIAATDMAAASHIVAKAQAGEDFERLVRDQSSRDQTTGRRDMGWAVLPALPGPLRETVGTLKIGDVGGPVPLGAEFLVVRLEERRPARPKTLAEARPEIERRLLSARQREVLRSWLTEQEKQSTIEVLR